MSEKPLASDEKPLASNDKPLANSQKLLCEIYRCSKKEGMYIYIDKQQGLDSLPTALKQRAGKMELAMTLVLTPDKKLARAQAQDVLVAIANQGFYLQMPPSLGQEQGELVQRVDDSNHMIDR